MPDKIGASKLKSRQEKSFPTHMQTLDFDVAKLNLSPKLQKSLYLKMLEIRRFEERAIELYQKGVIWGYLHPCIGEEAVAVGTCLAINRDDYIISTHRGHGHCIAKGGELSRMMAELLGKETGYCKGRGGSMHIADTSLGILGANGIVGGGIPIVLGAGITSQLSKNNRVSICFFGDGAANNGVLHESMNMAAIWKLPIIYLCENNQYAISMHVCKSTSIANIGERACAYGIPGAVIDGMDVEEVYAATKAAAKRARSGDGPSLIEAKTYRFYGHHPNDPGAYRDKKEVEFFKANKDPLTNYQKKLLDRKTISQKDLDDMEADIKTRIDEAVDFAMNSPETTPDEFIKEISEMF